jgi:polyhydroxyalkanoate synthesis regulator phasin
MKKVIAALAAAGVLVAAAFTASIVTDDGIATAQVPDEGTTTTTTTTERPEKGAAFREVLDELVAAGTITQDQADAIEEAMVAKHEELRESGEGFRHHRRGRGGSELRGLLEDDVITADELAELPDDHPLNDPDGPAADYLDDGQLTTDELKEIREQMHEQRSAESEGTDA